MKRTLYFGLAAAGAEVFAVPANNDPITTAAARNGRLILTNRFMASPFIRISRFADKSNHNAVSTARVSGWDKTPRWSRIIPSADADGTDSMTH
jgi:hypothetical protein